jgi:hypothetical protein
MSVCIFGLGDRMQNNIPSTEHTVMLSIKELESLQRDRRFLRALEAAGVDNWEGYEEALETAGRYDKKDL